MFVRIEQCDLSDFPAVAFGLRKTHDANRVLVSRAANEASANEPRTTRAAIPLVARRRIGWEEKSALIFIRRGVG